MSADLPAPPDEEFPPDPPHLRGVRMSHAERLRWLEEAKAAFGKLLGRARPVPPAGQAAEGSEPAPR